MLIGWALGFGTRAMWLYAAGITVAFHVRVLLYEEPRLSELFGEEWGCIQTRGSALARSAVLKRQDGSSHGLRL